MAATIDQDWEQELREIRARKVRRYSETSESELLGKRKHPDSTLPIHDSDRDAQPDELRRTPQPKIKREDIVSAKTHEREQQKYQRDRKSRDEALERELDKIDEKYERTVKYRKVREERQAQKEQLDRDRRATALENRERRINTQQPNEMGKRPYNRTPDWQAPGPANRGRPRAEDGRHAFHLDHRVGSHACAMPSNIVSADAYITRHLEQIAADPINAARVADDYINRYETDQLGIHTYADLRTNMSTDPHERAREWEARSKHERKARKPRVNIKAEVNLEFCKRIMVDPATPPGLQLAILKDVTRVEAGQERQKSKKAGEPWIDDSAAETYRWLTTRYSNHAENPMAPPPFALGVPRSGRVFYTMNAEIPAKLTDAARNMILDDLSHKYEQLKLTYLLVLHRPDQQNHPDNYHVHLMYADRPVRKLADGSFDIEQLVEKDYGRGRSKTVHQRQKKNRVVTERDWFHKIRTVHAEACNNALESEGHARDYYSGSFNDLNIDEQPLLKLGTKQTRLERAGVATHAGTHNAVIEWDRVDRRREHKYLLRKKRREAQREQMLSSSDTLSAAQIRLVEDWLEATRARDEAEAAAEETQDAIDKALSRAVYVAKHAAGVAEDPKQSIAQREGWAKRAQSAERFIVKRTTDLAQEFDLLRRAQVEAAAQTVIVEQLHTQITAMSRRTENSAVKTNVPDSSARVSNAPAASHQSSKTHRFIDQVASSSILVREDAGYYAFDERILIRVQLTQKDFADARLQARLAGLFQQQQADIARVIAYQTSTVRKSEVSAPTPYMAQLLDRWSDHEQVIKAAKKFNAQQAAISDGAAPVLPQPPKNELQLSDAAIAARVAAQQRGQGR